jgi:methyl-accepting chemotaxis protein
MDTVTQQNAALVEEAAAAAEAQQDQAQQLVQLVGVFRLAAGQHRRPPQPGSQRKKPQLSLVAPRRNGRLAAA